MKRVTSKYKIIIFFCRTRILVSENLVFVLVFCLFSSVSLCNSKSSATSQYLFKLLLILKFISDRSIIHLFIISEKRIKYPIVYSYVNTMQK